jgi:hypothetical protein
MNIASNNRTEVTNRMTASLIFPSYCLGDQAARKDDCADDGYEPVAVRWESMCNDAYEASGCDRCTDG